MILIHLLTGLVFGVTSAIFSIYAGHDFFIGLLRYSVLGAGGMLVSAVLSLIPLSAVVQVVLAMLRPNAGGRAIVSRTGDLRHALDGGAFGKDVARSQNI